MKNLGETIRLAATDISNHLFCGHLTALNVSESRGERISPPVRAPHLAVIQARGLDHERAYLEHLVSEGLSISTLDDHQDDVTSVAETLKAMAAGIEVIVQGALQTDVPPATTYSFSLQLYDSLIVAVLRRLFSA